MRKLLIILIMVIVLCGCSKTNNLKDIEDIVMDSEIKDKQLKLKINDNNVDVSFIDNQSTISLKKIANNGLTINMEMYGGFEQVGDLNYKLPSNDTKITTKPGDIVLYNSSKIVIFYGSNTWEYTKLGHINLNTDELKELLSKKDVVITLYLSDN